MTEKKKFNHNEIEICSLSKKKIDTTKENYAIIVDCEGRKIRDIKFYKQEELRNLIKGNVEKITKRMMEKTQKLAGGVLRNFFEKSGMLKKEYEVRA